MDELRKERRVVLEGGGGGGTVSFATDEENYKFGAVQR